MREEDKKEKGSTPITTWEIFARLFRVLEVISIIAGLGFIWVQLKSINYNQTIASEQWQADQDIREIQFIRDYKKEFTTGVNGQIYIAIKYKLPVLKESGGRFTADELNEYLSLFSQLALVADKKFINGNVIWSFFYYHISYTFENKEIQTYIQKQQEYSPGRFSALGKLYKYLKDYQAQNSI